MHQVSFPLDWKKKGNIIWTFWYDLTKSEQNVLDTNSGTLRIHSSISHSVQIPSNIWWEKKKKAGLGACLCHQRDEEVRMRGKHWIYHSLPSTHAGTDATCSLAISFASQCICCYCPWSKALQWPLITELTVPSPSESWLSLPLSPPGILQVFPLFLGTQKIL